MISTRGLNPLTVRSDLNVTSPYNSNQLSCKKVMRAENLINWRALFWNETIFMCCFMRKSVAVRRGNC